MGSPGSVLEDGVLVVGDQSVTANVIFSNPSNAVINFSPIVYLGSFN